MTSSDGFNYSQSSASDSPKLELNNEQIHALLNKLSSDEQKELTEMMRNCTTEVTMTRGLPITGAILASLYVARQRLPAQYHFGPKGWPFYAIMGVASLTASNLLFMGTCRDRIKPRIDQLWMKYDQAKSSTNYEEIRRQHRGVSGESPMIRSEPRQQDPSSVPQRVEKRNPYDYTYSVPSSEENTSSYGDSFTSYKPLVGETSEFQQSPRVRRSSPPVSSYSDSESSFISGTPSGPPSSDTDKNQGYSFS